MDLTRRGFLKVSLFSAGAVAASASLLSLSACAPGSGGGGGAEGKLSEVAHESIAGHTIDRAQYDNYTQILKAELIAANGCTEPIAIAFAAAKARETLGRIPTSIRACCSGSVIKNAKSAVVPNTTGHKGVPTAAIVGALACDSSLELELIDSLDQSKIADLDTLLEQDMCTVELKEGVKDLYILVEVEEGGETASVELRGKHIYVSRVVKNGKVIEDNPDVAEAVTYDKSKLNVIDILAYANTVDLAEVEDVLERQIADNKAISDEGLTNDWGSCVGKTIAEVHGQDTAFWKAVATAAAGSDARMSGCSLPVVINSGSGNQGITVSLPVIIFAEALGASHEWLLRSLIASNLIALHQKRFVGELSAFCGAVSAATAAACGIAFMRGDSYDIIGKTIVTSLGTTGGVFCDGAKSSCAGKIATSVQTALSALDLAERDRAYRFGDGLVNESYEHTIEDYGDLARNAMTATNEAILTKMLASGND